MPGIKRSAHIFALVLSLGMVAMAPLAVGQNINEDIYDPRSNTGRSGVSTPREYYIPSNPSFQKLDIQEFNDYRKTHYSPYAQVQVLRAIQVGKTYLKPGYYLVKLDIVKPPPKPVETHSKLASFEARQTSVLEWVQSLVKGPPDPENPAGEPRYEKRKIFPTVTPQSAEDPYAPRLSLMIKQSGQIELVIPVSQSETADERIKKGSKAQFVTEIGDPLQPQLLYLKYCTQQICYRSVPLEPGLVQ